MLHHGFAATIDLRSGATTLRCRACGQDAELPADDGHVVLAATVTTYLAAHDLCGDRVSA